MRYLLLLLTLVITPALALADNGFTYQGKPINPACVAMFNSSEADLPYIRTINLNTCQRSNAAYQTTQTDPNNSYYFYKNDKDASQGQYSYQVIGKTTNGVYVVKTQSSGGGTGVSSDLLLIRLYGDNEYVYNRSTTPKVNKIQVMVLTGYVNGGDRCVGDFASAKVVGNKLILAQFQGSNAADCNKTATSSIDLSQIK